MVSYESIKIYPNPNFESDMYRLEFPAIKVKRKIVSAKLTSKRFFFA